MSFGFEARADRRVLINAAACGSALGLALGAAYLGAVAGKAAVEHGAMVRVALGPDAGFAAPADPAVATQLRGIQGLDPDALRIAAARPTRARELDCLTQAVYFEARGESARGQQAVATVIMNRVKNPNFPKTVCGVVYQGAARHNGCQFSFACDGQAERVVEHSAWDRARGVAARVISGAVLRDIGSATHFHAEDVDPSWGSRMLRVAQVGLHVFYRFNPHAPRPVEADDADDTVQFASAQAAAPPQLRLAEAVIAPTPAAPPAAVETKPASAAPEAKPADATAAGVAKVDAPVPAKPAVVATAS